MATCFVVIGSVFGGFCLYCTCYEPKRVLPRTTPSTDDITQQKRYNDLINTPPEYQAIAEQPLQTIDDIVSPPIYAPPIYAMPIYAMTCRNN